MLHVPIKGHVMSMIRVEVNPGDFLKSIQNVGDFTRQFKSCYYIINTEDSLEYWGIGM